MSDLEFSFILYFCIAGISILGMGITGYLIEKRKGLKKSFKVPEPKILFILGIWFLFYIVAFLVEWLGHLLGLWIWFNINHIFLHAAYWWATLLTISIFYLSDLSSLMRYVILLAWVLFFEYTQEALVQWVTHFPLLNNPYLMITITMSLVCSLSIKILDILIKIKLLRKE